MATTRKEAHKAEQQPRPPSLGGEVDSDEAPEAPVEETKKVFFSIVDRQALRRGDFTSVTDLTAAIGWSCRSWNDSVALSRNVLAKPSKVEALLHGRAPRKGRTTRPCP